MNKAVQHFESIAPDHRVSGSFVFACGVAFLASVGATAYFCRSMCCEMDMPGGWTMSMMWLRMPGQTWAASAASFLLMWLVMMVAMMMPSAVPMFLSMGRSFAGTRTANMVAVLTAVAGGYFAVWLAVGAVVYAAGVAFAAAALGWEPLSRAVPMLSGASLVAAGLCQLTPRKMASLLRCRVAARCDTGCVGRGRGFLLGCQEGAACCVCCAAPMMIQLVLGMMNPLVMAGVALAIAAEKLLPRPEIVSRLIGIAAILAGIGSITGILLTH